MTALLVVGQDLEPMVGVFHSVACNMIESMTPAIALAIAAAYVVGDRLRSSSPACTASTSMKSAVATEPQCSALGWQVPGGNGLVGDTMKGVVGAAMGMIASGTAILRAVGVPRRPGRRSRSRYPVFHRFKGGKGVATGLGVLMFTVPVVALIDLAAWVLLLKVTKTASISSLIVVLASIPLAIWQGVSGMSLVWLLVTIALVVWRHRGNIQRVLRGRKRVPT
jgi:acyl-phosphate glycerol 3-phosphate acyltransferase